MASEGHLTACTISLVDGSMALMMALSFAVIPENTDNDKVDSFVHLPFPLCPVPLLNACSVTLHISLFLVVVNVPVRMASPSERSTICRTFPSRLLYACST